MSRLKNIFPFSGSKGEKSKLHSFLCLAPPERRLLIKSVVLLVLVKLGLWLVSFNTLLNRIERIPSKRKWASNSNGIRPDQIAWAVSVASRYVPDTKCLPQALVAQILCTHHGYPACLRIGVAKNNENSIEAHAWVEIQGRIVVGDLMNLSQYNPLVSSKLEKS